MGLLHLSILKSGEALRTCNSAFQIPLHMHFSDQGFAADSIMVLLCMV